MWSKDEDSCRTRLVVCERELADFAEYMSGIKMHCGVRAKADKDAAVGLHQQLKNNTPFETSPQLAAVPAGGSGCYGKTGIVKYEKCDVDNRLSVKLRDTGRSCSDKQLDLSKHSSHSVTHKALQTGHEIEPASSQSTSMYICDESCRADQSEIYRSDVDDRRRSVSCDNVAVMNVTSKSQISESQGNDDRIITENSPRGLCQTDWHHDPRVRRESDQGWLVKDISSSRRSLSSNGRLAVMGDTSASHAKCRSCDLLLPDAPDSPSYLDLYGRGSRHLYQNQALTNSTDSIVHSYLVRDMRPFKYPKLELLQTTWTPPARKTSVFRQTVVAHQSPLSSRFRYIRAASEPRRVIGIPLDYTCSFTVSNKLQLYESKCDPCTHDGEYVNNAADVYHARRTSLDAGLAAERARECLSCHDVYDHGLSVMSHRRQTVTQSDRTDETNAAYSRQCNDKDADSTCAQELLDTSRQGGFSCSADNRDAAEQPLMHSGSDHQLCCTDSTTVRSEDLSPVQSAPDAEEMSEILCKELVERECIKRIDDIDMRNSTTDVGEVNMLDGVLETNRTEYSIVSDLNDSLNTKRPMQKIGDGTEEVHNDMYSRITQDISVDIVVGESNASRLGIAPSTVEQRMAALSDGCTTVDTTEFNMSLVTDLNSRESSEVAVMKFSDGTRYVTTLNTEMTDSKHAEESVDSSAMAELSDAPESRVTDVKDAECLGKTPDTCKMATSLLSDSELANLNVDSYCGVTINSSKMKPSDTSQVRSDQSEPAVTLRNNAVHLSTSPITDYAPSLHTCEMATLSDNSHSGNTSSASDTRPTKLDDTEDAGTSPASTARDEDMCSDCSFPTVAVPYRRANTLALDDDTKSGSVITVSVVDPELDILADKPDVESDITADDHTCQVIEPREEMCSESSHGQVTVVNSSGLSADVTDAVDVQIISDSELTCRKEHVQSVNRCENVLHVPVRSGEVLVDDEYDVSLLWLDLSDSLDVSCSWPTTKKLTDQSWTDQQVNNKLCDGNDCLHAAVTLATNSQLTCCVCM